MKTAALPALLRLVVTFAAFACARAAVPAPDRPDPREIPLPRIAAPMGRLPGVDT